MHHAEKYAAMRELLDAARRDLQLVDVALEQIGAGRVPVVGPNDVASEHRVAWLGATDDLDRNDGIRLGAGNVATTYGFGNIKTGTIRNQDDAAFVCTNIFVGVGGVSAAQSTVRPFTFIFEDEMLQVAASADAICVPMLRLTDGSSGRSLIEGNNVAPENLESGFVPFSAIGSIRPGLGSNVKNKLFSEFTIPRAGVVKVEVVNAGVLSADPSTAIQRALVTLFGYKVYGA